VHLIGVAGAGMRGLGVLLLDAGFRLSGCDRAGAAALDELTERGAVLSAGHAAAHVEGADLVIFSSAVPADHPELLAAAEVGVPVMKRARALAALLNDRRLAAVSGTHGKTTITALAGLACSAAGLDPIVAVGGRVVDWNGYARPGAGEVAVVEADEYDRSFLDLDPSLLLISSVEPEHLDTYGTLEELERAYLVLAERARARDGVLYCADDAGARRIGGSVGGTSYGLAADADCRVEVLAREGSLQRCRLTLAAGGWDFDLEIPGEHNAQNAAGALAMALRLASANSSGVLLEGELLETGALASAFEGLGASIAGFSFSPTRPVWRCSTTTPTTRPRWRPLSRRSGGRSRSAGSWPCSNRTCTAGRGRSPTSSARLSVRRMRRSSCRSTRRARTRFRASRRG